MMMLKAIFYSRFHPERGPSVIHQYPYDSVISSASSDRETLINFSNISSYIISSYELCNRPLSISINGHRVLGFPVSLEDAKYERNRFTFNVGFVLDENEDSTPWKQVVRKTAAFFKELEEEDGLLQTEELLDGLKWAGDEKYPAQTVGILYTLLEAMTQDLNTYGETCVRVDDLHVLNLRLTASKPVAPKVKAWDVPLLIRPLPSPDEWTWDLTLQRIHPHIDGIKHVMRIADVADVELKLVKQAIRELSYHERVILLDIFHFQAIYDLTSDFACFVKDHALQDECAMYVATDPKKNIFRDTGSATSGSEQVSRQPHRQTLVGLYRDLNPGASLHDFCLAHEAQLANIDIHRFITFGVIKGFLRRIQKHALAIESRHTPPRIKMSNGSGETKPRSAEDAEREWDRAWKKAAFSSGWATPPIAPPPESLGSSVKSSKSAEVDQSEDDEKLRRFLDGKHCMDEICVAMRMSEKKVVEKLRGGRFGEVVVFCR